MNSNFVSRHIQKSLGLLTDHARARRGRRHTARFRRAASRVFLESLEDRTMLSTFWVRAPATTAE
jgi:hypothetical protein